MRGLIAEFRQFALQGSVTDMVVGIVVGAGFKDVVQSLVNDIILPPITLLAGGVDYSDLFITLRGPRFATLAEARAAGAVTLNYGHFLSVLLQFTIIAFVIFLLIKQVNKLRGETKQQS